MEENVTYTQKTQSNQLNKKKKTIIKIPGWEKIFEKRAK